MAGGEAAAAALNPSTSSWDSGRVMNSDAPGVCSRLGQLQRCSSSRTRQRLLRGEGGSEPPDPPGGGELTVAGAGVEGGRVPGVAGVEEEEEEGCGSRPWRISAWAASTRSRTSSCVLLPLFGSAGMEVAGSRRADSRAARRARASRSPCKQQGGAGWGRAGQFQGARLWL